MSQITITIPDESLAVLAESPDEAASAMRMLAAVKLFEMKKLSSGAAARLAGIGRVEFLHRLADYGVPVFDMTEQEFEQETRLASVDLRHVGADGPASGQAPAHPIGLSAAVIVPGAVANELGAGRSAGHQVPDITSLSWAVIRTPTAKPPLPDAHQLDAGESDVLWLSLETPGSISVLDEWSGPTRGSATWNSIHGNAGASARCQKAGSHCSRHPRAR